MNSYLINILFRTEDEARVVHEKYSACSKDERKHLESAVPLMFDTERVADSDEITIGSLDKFTNEIEI